MSEHKRKKVWQANPNPASIDECFHRAVARHQKGDLAQAEIGYREVLVRAPHHVATLHLVGVVMLQTGRLVGGIEMIDKALAIAPNNVDALNNRGNALIDLKRPGEALLSFEKALAIKPEFAEAWNNRGDALQELERYDEALACHDKALALKPNYLDALNNRGAALRSLDRFEEAVAGYDQALAIKPDFPDALNNRGNALKELRRFEEALVSYDRALAIKPDFADALSNRGGVLKELKQFEEAFISYDRALAIKPDFAEAIFNRAIARLLLGDFAGGWPGYESRWDRKELSKRKLEASCPVWRGEPISRRRIIVYEEQGLGDIIQFSRYLRLLSESGAEVTFLLRTRMRKLMGGLDETILVTDRPPEKTFDYQCALLSLPQALGTTLADVPTDTPYLRADPERARKWRARLGDEGFKIGVAWQGNKTGKIDRAIVRARPLSRRVPASRRSPYFVAEERRARTARRVARRYENRNPRRRF